MFSDDVSRSADVVAALRAAAARVDAATADRVATARMAAVGWRGAGRERFDAERARQSAGAAQLAQQGRRLAVELEEG